MMNLRFKNILSSGTEINMQDKRYGSKRLYIGTYINTEVLYLELIYTSLILLFTSFYK